MKKNVPIHLQLDPARDVETHRLKRRSVHVLKTAHGGSNCGDRLPVALCGACDVKRVVAWKERERVTCAHCKRLMLVRFPGPPTNPRSGMKMPRPLAQNVLTPSDRDL